MRILWLISALFLLGACDTVSSWMGTEKKETPKLEGERIAILPETQALLPDASLMQTPAVLPSITANDAWPQHGGGANGNLSLGVRFEHRQSAEAGEGNSFHYALVPPPVVANRTVFAMDSEGKLSAHDANDISEIRWTSAGVADEDEQPIMGGGIAYAEGRIYATAGRGIVAAFDAKTGAELWRQRLDTPVRAAPRVADGRVYVVSDDSQAFALDAASGAILWTHRGVNEGTGFLMEATPAVAGDVVIVAYSSGEVHVLRAASGEQIWGDVVIAPQQQAAVSTFTGISADPVVIDGLLYVAGSAGEIAAFDLTSGRRVWEQAVSSMHAPWVAGDYLYVLNSDSAVVALQRMDGRVRWIRQLPAYENEEKKKGRFTWNGPVLAGGRLLITGAHGQMVELSPQDGSVLVTTDIPDDIYTAPVVAGNALYLQSDDATLYALN